MKPPAFLLICGLLAVLPACAAQDQQPIVEGYITHAASNSNFDVNGIHILCGKKTQVLLPMSPAGNNTIQGCPHVLPYLGEPIRVYGSLKRKQHAVDATLIMMLPEPSGEISGSAVIDALPSQNASETQSTGLLVRADGYRIQIGANAKISWVDPLDSLSDVRPGDWIYYKGAKDSAGVVAASSVKLSPEVVSKGEQNLLTKSDFDPSMVPSSAKQNLVKMAFVGIDPKRFPPYTDPAMQARVTAIGEKLIAPYQQKLSNSDPDRIQFRFQVIDTKMLRDALAMPSGVILVPRQVVERMQSDSQLAAVIADNIASVLERQRYRALPASNAAAAGYYGTQIVGLFVPGVGLAGMAASVGTVTTIQIKAQEQSGRVSLGLLHDAGYDIGQAPLAWWLLAPKKPKPISNIQLPPRAAYLYRILGEFWRNPAAQASITN